ncbi:hypothetical protein [Paractinoplanes maris]|uniref:hypothetical protein n=1 Tax=Paractinoplanes maris TaxID=1734446 RepID=UPI0020216680|nr:hypothetical protein [Actinoplanes maris]
MEQTVPVPLSAEERSELDQLRAEVATLRRHSRRTPGGAVRVVFAVLLLALGSLLAPVAVAAIWLGNQVQETDRYVATVAPLAEDPAIQRAVTDRITDEIFARLDVRGLTDQAADALEDRGAQVAGTTLHALAPPIANGVRDFTHDRIAQLVGSDQFAQIWTEANRAAHTQLVAALTGERDGTLVVEDDTVSLRLQPFVEAVKQRLIAEGFTLAERIPAIDVQFTILESSGVERAQGAFDLIDRMRVALPVAVLVLLTVGVLLARDRRRAVAGAALGVAGGMLLLGLALALGRSAYLNAIPSTVLPRDAATVVFDTLVRFLRTGLRAVLAVALVTALVAYASGPSAAAVAGRRVAGRGFSAVRSGAWRLGLRTGPVGPFVRAHKRWLRVVVAAVAGLVLVFWDYPDARVVLGIAVVALAVLLLIELIGGRTPRPPVPTEGGTLA